MTEEEWLSGKEGWPPSHLLGNSSSVRKYRFFALACAQIIEGVRWFPAAVEMMEALDCYLDNGRGFEEVCQRRQTLSRVRAELSLWADDGCIGLPPNSSGVTTIDSHMAERIAWALRLIRWAATTDITIRCCKTSRTPLS
jgi:hypothetical protein